LTTADKKGYHIALGCANQERIAHPMDKAFMPDGLRPHPLVTTRQLPILTISVPRIWWNQSMSRNEKGETMKHESGSVSHGDIIRAGGLVTSLPGRTLWRLILSCLAAAVCWTTPALGDDIKPEVLERSKKAAVMVRTAISRQQKGDTELGFGSGYFINRTGLMVTNNHVADPTHSMSPEQAHVWNYQNGKVTWWIVTDAGTSDEKRWEAEMVMQNKAADQAILQVLDKDANKLETPNYLHLLPESQLRDHMPVWAMGFPGADRQKTSKDKKAPLVTITNGHTLASPRTPGGRIRMIYTDVIARPGNSGGAMINGDGFPGFG